MTKTLKDVELSERLRTLVQERFGDRGRFRLLQEVSGIPEWKWKNFFYRRQEAGQDQIQFWVSAYPEDEHWMMTGTHQPDRESFPFSAMPPVTREDTSTGDRLRWVIEEFAAPRGEALFSYLARRYREGITPEDWERVILKKAEPTLKMVQLICSDRPLFAQWVLLGHAYTISVDPTDKMSVQRWNQSRNRLES